MNRAILSLTLLACLTTAQPPQLLADQPRALPAGQRPSDARLGPLRHLDGDHPFTPVPDRAAWEARAAGLRTRVLLAAGLWPLPQRTPLKPIVHGRVDREGYTVDRVILESLPGHFVTGSLYRPQPAPAGKLPVVLCPHGHWNQGRFHDHGEAGVRKEIAQGAERFPIGGRHPLQARCVQLARMGCVAFLYDMEGYADSVQLPHRAGPRAEASGPALGDWGLFSPQAELRLQTPLSLQTWNAVRALDFLLDLPEADPQRVAVTGASGGATQTLLLTALDPRVRLAFPAVMVSTSMQGGCPCENASHLRVDAGNIDLAALAAPRPLAITAANDWTRELRHKGYPDLVRVYQLLGVPENFHATFNIQFDHNFNSVSRQTMYEWVNRHFKLGLPSPIEERDFTPLSVAEATVWSGDHPKPDANRVGMTHERELMRHIAQASDQQLAPLLTAPDAGGPAARAILGPAWETLLHPPTLAPASVEFVLSSKAPRPGALLITGLLRHSPRGVELPVAFLHPKDWNQKAVLLLTPAGKAGLFNPDGLPTPLVQGLLDAGFSVTAPDLIEQGEFRADGKPLLNARTNDRDDPRNPWRRYAPYTFGYNPALFAQRTHDVLTVLSFLRHDDHRPQRVLLVATAGAGHFAAAALPYARGLAHAAAIDTAGFRFNALDRHDHPDFLPGAVKYGDLPGLLTLAAPLPLLLTGEPEASIAPIAAAYRTAHAQSAFSPTSDPWPRAAIDWLRER